MSNKGEPDRIHGLILNWEKEDVSEFTTKKYQMVKDVMNAYGDKVNGHLLGLWSDKIYYMNKTEYDTNKHKSNLQEHAKLMFDYDVNLRIFP